MVYLLIFILVLLLMILLLNIFSIKNGNRSFLASVVEIYLFLTSKRKWHARLPFTFNIFLNWHYKHKNDYYKLPKFKNLCSHYEVLYNNSQIFVFNENKNANNVILYLHGGAYISRPTKYHIKFINKLAKKTNSIIIFPIYPKTPKYTCIDTFEFVKDFYHKIYSNSTLPIILMGDSSGGGLSLALVQNLSINDNMQPSKTILISPWIDLSFSHPEIKKYEKTDPLLSIAPLKKIVTLYASNLDLYDFRVSPYYGNVSKLKNVTIFSGNREILYPEITSFYQRCKQENADVKLIIKNGLNHAYPLFPIPEGKDSLNIISKIINK